MGFVARVDDGAFEGGLQSEDRVDVVGTLAELVSGGLAALPYADAAGSGVDLRETKWAVISAATVSNGTDLSIM